MLADVRARAARRRLEAEDEQVSGVIKACKQALRFRRVFASTQRRMPCSRLGVIEYRVELFSIATRYYFHRPPVSSSNLRADVLA